ncbi:MAG: hypothetical protein ACC628_08195 [Pirellulaceae bacterium]
MIAICLLGGLLPYDFVGMANSEVVEQRIAAVRLGFDECAKSIPRIAERAQWKKMKEKIKKEIEKLEEQNKPEEVKALRDKLQMLKSPRINSPSRRS